MNPNQPLGPQQPQGPLPPLEAQAPAQPPVPGQPPVSNQPYPQSPQVQAPASGMPAAPYQTPAQAYAPPEQPATPGQNPYDFILNSAPAPKKTFGLGANSMAGRILIVLGGGAVLLTLFIIVFSVLSSAGKTNTDALIRIAQRQQLLIAIADKTTDGQASSSTKSLAITTKLSLVTAQNDTLQLLAQNGVKSTPEQLNTPELAKATAALETAKQNNTFDATLNQLLEQNLTEYQKGLRDAYNNSTNPRVREVLGEQFKQTQVIVAPPQAAS